MARRSNKQLVAEAIQHLQQHEMPEHAAVIQKLAENAEPGWKVRPPEGANFSLWIERDVKARVLEKVKAEDTTVAKVITRGLDEFLAGRYTPQPPSRGGGKTSLTVRLDDALETLMARVDVAAAARVEELGWKATARLIGVSYLRDVYVPAPQE